MITYSKQTYDAVRAGDIRRLGVQLGAACIDAQIPVQVVARWLGVSRQGVYNWFVGVNDVAPKHQSKVTRIVGTLLRGLDDKKLPAADLATALDIVNQYKKDTK